MIHSRFGVSLMKFCPDQLTLKKFISKMSLFHTRLILIWVGFLGVRFEVWGSGVEGVKLVAVMLQLKILVRKYTHMRSFRKYNFFYQGPLKFADVSIFCNISAFFGKNSTFTQSNSVRAVLKNL